MSTALTVTLIVVMILSVASTLGVAALFSKTIARAFAHADLSHARMLSMHESLLDRVMAGDFAAFKTMQLTEQAPDGEWEPPDELGHVSMDEHLRRAETMA